MAEQYKKSAWFYAIVYVGFSLGVEILLMVVFRLQVPRDNAVLTPFVLIIPPGLAAWLCGYRGKKQLLVLWVLTLFLTLLITGVFGRITGVSTGLAAPLIIRTTAGYMALLVTRFILAGKG